MWLVIGITVRMVAIDQPLIDAHAIRQCYTAVCTRSILRERGFPLSSIVNWRGDQGLRLVLEVPIYNYMAIGIDHLLHNLDASGKVASIALWAASFLVLQNLWKRCLNPREAFWANSLFVLSPISIFFGQAYSPEMLVQFLGLCLVWRFLCYQESGSRIDFFCFAAVGCVASLVKAPEVFHLVVFSFILLLIRERWRLFVRWEYWLAGAATVFVIHSWSGYVTPITAAYDESWTPARLLSYYFKSWGDRLDPMSYVRFCSYLVPFVMAFTGMGGIALGAFVQIRERGWTWPAFWVLSAGLYYMTWGFGPAQHHSYYQLPALPACCYLFGLGMARLRAFKSPWISRYGTGVLAGATLAFAAFGTWYLFRQDRVIYDSAIWTMQHSAPSEGVIFKSGHDHSSFNFPHEAVFAYYADRPVWLDTTYLSPPERQRAEQSAAWVVETYPVERQGRVERVRRLLKGAAPLPPPQWQSVSSAPEWTLVHEAPQIRIYHRGSLASATDSSNASTAEPGHAGEARAPRDSSSSPTAR